MSPQPTTDSTRPGVLVVVPVYGDLESLLGCVTSLKSTVDFDRHSVLLVNDCGPDADEIETALLAAIDGHSSFRYARNDRNLGFVGTCNRAALELDDTDRDILLLNSDTVTTPGFVDEMQSVLYADDTHGVVCARSNNATIASLPFRLSDRRAERTIERTQEVYDAVGSSLPRWYVSPVAMGFCFLTRRTLIARFGLFDDAFAPGYGEENDYCLRINGEGYTSLIANRALVFHAGSKSFVGEKRNTLRATHQKILEQRYPFYGDATGSFLRFVVHPADRFADVLVPGPAAPRLTVDLRGLPASTSAATVARSVSTALSDAFALEIVVDQDARGPVEEAATGAKVVTSVHPDDLVPLTLFVRGGVDGDRLLEANRRSLAWALLDVGAPDERWAAVAPHAAQRFAAEEAGAWALGTVTPETAADLAGVWSEYLSAPVTDRILTLEARWSRLLVAEAVSERTATDDSAALQKARSELLEIRDSRSYKLGNTAVGAAKRLLRRPV